MLSKILAGSLIVLGLFGMGSACDDPGDPKSPSGKAHHVVVSITNGTVISKKNYGMYKADKSAPDHCYWNVSKKGKIVALGGKYDSVIAGTGLRGGVLHTSCGTLWKAFS